MDRLCDRLWIWGHPTNSLFGAFGINKESSMSPLDGMNYLGAKNIFSVPMGRHVDRVTETEKLYGVREVGWSVELAAEKPENVAEVVALAEKYPNVTRAVFDDFFNDENEVNNYLHYTPDLLSRYREQLHRAGAEMWMVLYTKQLCTELDIEPFIREFDGISLWFWNEDDVKKYDARVSEFFRLTKDKRRLIGCYLYDFGGEKPSAGESVIYQLDKSHGFILSGQTEGVILHTNAVADLGFEGVEAARKWIKIHGQESVPELK